MSNRLLPAAALWILAAAAVPADPPSARLATGWTIAPAGTQIWLPGDMPGSFALSPDGKTLFVNTCGYNAHTLSAIDTATNGVLSSVDLKTDWVGLALDPDGSTLYVSGGRSAGASPPTASSILGLPIPGTSSVSAPATSAPRALLRVHWDGAHLSAPEAVAVATASRAGWYAAGLAFGPNRTLYAVNSAGGEIQRLLLSAAPGGGPRLASGPTERLAYRPYAVAVSPDDRTVAVSAWGAHQVALLDSRTLARAATIETGAHPCALAYGPDGRLFAANSGSNTVSVIDDGTVTETINTSLDPAVAVGATPIAVAVSPDGSRLYVANADNNDVAVIDIRRRGESRVAGFIPTGWYPCALAVSPDNRTLYVGIGKGLAGAPSVRTTIGRTLAGYVSAIPVPDDDQLSVYSRLAAASAPPQPAPAPLPAAFGRIKHVLYIIRENRTYDQVLGDVAMGNGDPSLVLFGRRITPNAHSLAGEFALLDNLYCDAEVSEDGHPWSDSAYATDAVERGWPLKYGGRPELQSDSRLTGSPGGYLWDLCARKGLSYRSYGEFPDIAQAPEMPPLFHGAGMLAGHMNMPWLLLPWGTVHDTVRARLFIRELHHAEQDPGDSWPSFMVMSLPEDHTQGLKAGAYTPAAAVASNDHALGMIVDAVSHSRFWGSTAIFVIEDDAQNGQDHVDAHRTVGLVISPYVRRHSVDHSFYTTASFVRTIELILGLPPMTEYDLRATPLTGLFAGKPDTGAYAAKAPLVDTEARNPDHTPGAAASAALDFTAPDRADPDRLNAILWSALRPTSAPGALRTAYDGAPRTER